MTITCFLPCRKGSERVPRKNIRPIASKPFGLLEIKLEQLLSTTMIDRIILSTNDEEIMDFAASLGNPRLDVRLRDESLASSITSTDELIEYVSSLIDDGHVIWTHVTSPFLDADVYDELLKTYLRELDNGYDSLMTVTELQGFIWDDAGPVNYDRGVEKWPRTQTLTPLYEVNSGAFVASASVYSERKDRIGGNPFKYKLDKVRGFDIDWEEDFQIAEALMCAGVSRV
ncbi:acylneuraminate cytidylyltransferase [Marinobacter psychrophilus]|uniref:Acylneuraminate cytidylyltransferase n=1 Tax=Marinobacter psychrophilus TaxID=330734 RepID=A0A0H4I185_9GAMM|nr:acylneuraminate cytidylyltransferase family protein [Marinobacter psychrophilus]AKO51593.1 acylneuraminate cytidylyltransferase [Marinobacter psychrophilus]